MSRRRSDGEQEFGSDSFLDIIANIVGILIILIVVAGVKVARQSEQSAKEISDAVAANTAVLQQIEEAPVEALSRTAWPWKRAEESSESNPDAATTLSLTIPEYGEADSGSKRPIDQVILDTHAAQQKIVALSLEVQTAKQLTAESESELQQLMESVEQRSESQDLKQNRLSSIDEEQTRLTARVLQLQQSAIEADQKKAAFQSTLASLEKRQTYVKNALQQISHETLRLREVLESEEASQPNGDRLKHRLSPVGKTVTSNDEEIHFRLSNGRIAHVPVMALVKRANEQAMRRGGLIGRVPRFQSVVGPIEGFRLQYTIVRALRSPAEFNSTGRPYQLRAENVEISPAETLQAEPVDRALRVGSRFRQILESAKPQTSISIWLYPNEFRYFRELRDFAHSLDLRVAAWPQKQGEPIGLNLHGGGSRSVAQ